MKKNDAHFNVDGVIRADEAYTVPRLATMFCRSPEWVLDTFVRPVDGTKRRRLDSEGKPVPGVPHFKAGASYVIPGQALIAWLIENSDTRTD